MPHRVVYSKTHGIKFKYMYTSSPVEIVPKFTPATRTRSILPTILKHEGSVRIGQDTPGTAGGRNEKRSCYLVSRNVCSDFELILCMIRVRKLIVQLDEAMVDMVTTCEILSTFDLCIIYYSANRLRRMA